VTQSEYDRLGIGNEYHESGSACLIWRVVAKFDLAIGLDCLEIVLHCISVIPHVALITSCCSDHGRPVVPLHSCVTHLGTTIECGKMAVEIK